MNKVRVDGRITFWRLPQHFNRDVLLEGLAKLGWKRHCPRERSNNSALKEALVYIVRSWKQDDVLVRELESVGEDGFVVVRETKGAQENQYETWFRTKWEQPVDTVEPYTVTYDGEFSADNSSIDVWFKHFRSRLTNHAVAKMLSVLIQDHLQGVSLKPSGGFYWIPPESVATYQELIKVVVAAADGDCTIYQPEFSLADESAVQAVRDAIVDDINHRAAVIESQASKEGVKETALKNRQRDAQLLHDRVKQYEGFLGETLDKCREVAGRCQKAVVDSALQQFPDFFGIKNKVNANEDDQEVNVSAEDVNPFALA